MTFNPQTFNIKYVLLAILILAASIALWWGMLPSQAPINTYTPANVSGAVKLVPKVSKPLPRGIKVYAAPAVARLRLPDSMKNQSVIAATECAPDLRPHTIVTVIDPLTGETETMDRRDPYHWLAAENQKEVRLASGWRGTERMSRLSASWDLVMVKGWHLGGTASVDGDKQSFIGGSVAYRF